MATLIIKYLKRTQKSKPDEVLEFEPGVNVLVGVGNTGKTKWVQMLDYLMGDPDPPESTFGNDLAEKYDSIEALFLIDGKEYVIERHWKRQGKKGKIFINEEEFPASEFSEFLLSKLETPILHFPTGNPYSKRSWPQLSWRMLYRHVYRRQKLWADFADKQPEAEQYACLLQFLGLAEYIFSDVYSKLVEKQNNVYQLETSKEAYLKALDEVSKDLVGEKEVQVALTRDSVDVAINRINAKITSLQQQRDLALNNLLLQSVQEDDEEQNAFNQLSRAWNELQIVQDANEVKLAKIKRRLEELQAYKEAIDKELARLQRTRSAGRILVDLKITHCPACDQTVSRKTDSEHCFLCHQPIVAVANDSGTKRIDFEAEQLKGEGTEVDELITTLVEDRKVTISERRYIAEEIQRVNSQMKPIRQLAASIIPPEVTVLDMESGRLQERVRQLERIKASLVLRERLSEDIDRIQAEVAELNAQVENLRQKVNLAKASDMLTDGMNTYLNALQSQGKDLWTQKGVAFKMRKRDFGVIVSGDDWGSKLGGTLTLYFLFAYHFALLNLVRYPDTHYPGLAVLDLPPTLEDGSTVKDDENFVLEPFGKLMEKPDMENTQIIVTGAAFENLKGVNRIELTQVWV